MSLPSSSEFPEPINNDALSESETDSDSDIDAIYEADDAEGLESDAEDEVDEEELSEEEDELSEEEDEEEEDELSENEEESVVVEPKKSLPPPPSRPNVTSLPPSNRPKITSLPPAPKQSAPIVQITESNVKFGKRSVKIDIDRILAEMPGISISGYTAVPSVIPENVNDLLYQEVSESATFFEARRRITMELLSIRNFIINNMTAVVAGHIIMTKYRLGVTYDEPIETAITELLKLLQL